MTDSLGGASSTAASQRKPVGVGTQVMSATQTVRLVDLEVAVDEIAGWTDLPVAVRGPHALVTADGDWTLRSHEALHPLAADTDDLVGQLGMEARH